VLEEEEEEKKKKKNVLKKCKQIAVLIIWIMASGWKNIVAYFYPGD
jgi:hypothetical protein